MTLNLPLRLRAAMAAEEEWLTRSGPSLHGREEVWTLRSLSQRETGESITTLACPSSMSRAREPPPKPPPRKGKGLWRVDLEGKTDTSDACVRSLQPRLGLLRTPETVLFPPSTRVGQLCSLLSREHFEQKSEWVFVMISDEKTSCYLLSCSQQIKLSLGKAAYGFHGLFWRFC